MPFGRTQSSSTVKDMRLDIELLSPKAGDLVILTVEKDEYNQDLNTREVFDKEIEEVSTKYPGATFLVLPKGVTVQQLPESVAKSVLRRIVGEK